jgi:hypothetical protein
MTRWFRALVSPRRTIGQMLYDLDHDPAGTRNAVPALAPLPKTHPPGRAQGAVSDMTRD